MGTPFFYCDDMAKNYKNVKPLNVEGITNIEQSAVKPPDYVPSTYYNSPYKVRDINEAPTYEPYSRYRKLGSYSPDEVYDQAYVEADVPFNQRRGESRSTSARSDRMRILPKIGTLLYDVFMNMGSKSQTVVDFLSNPDVTVSQEEENAFIQSGEYEEFNKHIDGYITRWETLNSTKYPREALDQIATPEFREWWYSDPIGKKVPKGPSSVIDPSLPKGVALPEIVTHGTYHVISRKDGFIQLNANDFEPKYNEWGEEIEWELGPHFGTPGQALDIVFEKEGKDNGVLPHRGHLPTYVQQNPQAFIKEGEQAKFYPGFLKVNNPLVIPEELGRWTFDEIINYLSLPAEKKIRMVKDAEGNEKFTIDSASPLEKAGFTYSKEHDPNQDTLGIPLGMGSGTAISKISEYAIDLAEQDGVQLSFTQDELEEQWFDMSEEEQQFFLEQQSQEDVSESLDIPIGETLKRDIHYYRNLGLMKFIQDDLGFDAIKYFNQVEDKAASDWSYILFSPNQFKSIYNEGTFKWTDENGKPWKDFMSKTDVPPMKRNTNKYKKKVAA